MGSHRLHKLYLYTLFPLHRKKRTFFNSLHSVRLIFCDEHIFKWKKWHFILSFSRSSIQLVFISYLFFRSFFYESVEGWRKWFTLNLRSERIWKMFIGQLETGVVEIMKRFIDQIVCIIICVYVELWIL